MICDLPTELHQCISDHLASDKDLNALVRACKSLYHSLNPHLYLRDVLHSHSAALLWAASHGRVETTRKALAAGADIHCRIDMSGAAIHVAARSGHLEVLKVLFEVEGADADATDELSGLTPLCLAAINGHDHIIDYLIYSCNADPNVSTRFYQQTPLILATESGRIKTVEKLLATGRVNVNQLDVTTNSALLHACTSGNLDIVKLLIADKRCEVNTKNNKGIAPLTQAVLHCHPQIVRALITVEGLDINVTDEIRNSPLNIAVRKGYADIVQILLDTGKVDIEYRGSDVDGTPLVCAAKHDHEDVLRLLLAVSGIEIDARDLIDYTPLMWSARQGNYSIFRMLRDAGDVNLDARDVGGRSVVSWALDSGSYEIVYDLLHSNKVCLTTIQPEPPLWTATRSRYWDTAIHAKVVQLLLDHDDVKDDFVDARGWTLLANAVKWDVGCIVTMLLDSPKINKQTVDRKGRTLLHIAACFDAYESAEVLLRRKTCDINARDRDGRTALLYACEFNREEVPKLLLEEEDLDLDAVHPVSGQNALFHAFEKECRATWITMLQTGRVSCDSKDRNGRTLLSIAASRGWIWNIKRLINLGADPCAGDDDGMTPLERARDGGYYDIIATLGGMMPRSISYGNNVTW